jgi:hypothetical protein
MSLETTLAGGVELLVQVTRDELDDGMADATRPGDQHQPKGGVVLAA